MQTPSIWPPVVASVQRTPRLAGAARLALGASLGLSALAGATLAQAQSVRPGAGDVQRAIDTPQQPQPRKDAPAPLTVQPAPAEGGMAPAGRRMAVKAIRINGASVVEPGVLQALLADVVGREVTLAELNQAIKRIDSLYQRLGYPVARAVLPVQEIREGVVEVMVLEGRIGQVQVDNQSLLDDATVQRLLGAVPAGTVVSGPDLSRRLLWLGDTAGASRAGVVLQPGQRTGETDLRVRVDGGPRLEGQVDVDNHGNRYTGYWRAAAQAAINSPAGLGDQVQLRTMLTDESLRYLRLGYRVPVAPGWAVGANWSMVDYRIGREYAPLQAKGWSHVGGLDATYALARSIAFNLNGTVGWDHKSFEDRIEVLDPDSVTRKTSDVLLLGLNGSGDWATGWAAGKYAFAGTWSHGQLRLPTAAQQASDAAGARTRGDFNKLVLNGNATWALTERWSLYGQALAQGATRNLDGSEKLSLGGATGVRAYPQGEATGDEGVLASLELRYNPALMPLQLAVFADGGQMHLDHQAYASGVHERRLFAVGLSATWAPRSDLGLKVMAATRAGRARVESEPDDSRTRLWVQGLWRF